MYTVIRNRDSGKAKELLEYARENNCIIITQDKRSFKVKAKNYGFNDVEIIDYEDLDNDSYPLGVKAVVHNGDKMLKDLIDRFYYIEVIGMSATANNERKNE